MSSWGAETDCVCVAQLSRCLEAQPELASERYGKRDDTLLMIAAANGNAHVVEMLLR